MLLSPSELIQHHNHHNRDPQPILSLSYDEVLNDNFQFDINSNDVMVFLHIQKTGGTRYLNEIC